MDAFRGELPARAERIDKAYRQHDRTPLFELAHRLKGSAGLYGFDNIAETARTICDRLRADDEVENSKLPYPSWWTCAGEPLLASQSTPSPNSRP